MRVILTGASGSLGKKYMDMFPETIPFHIRHEDSCGIIDLSTKIKNTDVIIHCGANVNPKSIGDAILDNSVLPLEILDMAGKINPNAHIILISSMSILGENGEPKKMGEMTHYAASKYIMEELAFKVANNPITIVRFFTLFYADQNRDGLSRIVYNAKRNKSISVTDCRRDFLPLDIACKWLNKLCNNKAWYNKSINLASGTNIKMTDVAEYLVDKYKITTTEAAPQGYSNICYKFDPSDAQSLEKISFDIYKLIDEYYRSI